MLLRLIAGATDSQIPEDNRDRELWKAVLVQAMEDAICPDPPPPVASHNYSRWVFRRRVEWLRESRAYFQDSTPDFETVCDYAGVSPPPIRRWVLGKIPT